MDQDASSRQEASSDDEAIDHNNYKGIYINDEPGQKFTDPETGAHFEFEDMCNRLIDIEKERRSVDARLPHGQQLLNPEEDFDIYKTHQGKPRHVIQTQSNKNKQEIIMQLNKKLDHIIKDSSRDKKKSDLNINTGSFSSNLLLLIHPIL